MAGTIEGGRKAATTNRQRHGKNFYARIGAAGGRNGTTGGFAANRELARVAGAKGGRISRRRKTTATAVKQIEVTQIQDDTSKQSDLELAA